MLEGFGRVEVVTHEVILGAYGVTEATLGDLEDGLDVRGQARRGRVLSALLLVLLKVLLVVDVGGLTHDHRGKEGILGILAALQLHGSAETSSLFGGERNHELLLLEH